MFHMFTEAGTASSTKFHCGPRRTGPKKESENAEVRGRS
jgi:hypothetical protein